ncbi:O-antigen ligase family protein [Pseudorhizobium flavum]|uniref:O-antigen ligase n=1 Tax=Pseudorhizobium flavum TaxID=1335061 RepID=A0A7X0DEW7_9HYPH|nr:O-antigen ligase family protein [Pseudorhizobium flavum]MBB6182342.1 O-antigen ligase [Pseudorhizobium flavum]CAD6632053.1 ligase [Pseudorhizobium flavum]
MRLRLIALTFYLLVLLSIWSPTEELPSWIEFARYVIFLLLSGTIIISTFSLTGMRTPKGIEAELVALFVIYFGISAFWGAQHPDSYIKSLLLLNAGLTSVAIAVALPLEQTLRIIFLGLVTLMILSLITIVFFPGTGIENSWKHAGKWRGIVGQKNGFGTLAAFSFVAAVALPLKHRTSPSHQWLSLVGRIGFALLSLISLYMAGSRGSLLISAIGIISLLISQMPKIVQRAALVGAVVITLPLFNIVLSTIEVDADKVGVAGVVVDTDSRIKLWRFGFEQMAERELFGVGLASFWTEERKTQFSDANGWVLDNFHNGYITVLVETGVIGLLLYLFAFGALYLLLIVSIGAIRDRYLALVFAYTNMFTVINLVENEIGRSTSLLIFIFLIIAFSLREHVRQQLAARTSLTVLTPHH